MSKTVHDVLIALIQSPLAYIMLFMAASTLGHLYSIPILEEVVPALNQLKALVLPGVFG